MRNSVHYSRLGRGVHGRPPLPYFLIGMPPPTHMGEWSGVPPLSDRVLMKDLNAVYDGECRPEGRAGQRRGFTRYPPQELALETGCAKFCVDISMKFVGKFYNTMRVKPFINIIKWGRRHFNK